MNSSYFPILQEEEALACGCQYEVSAVEDS